MGNRVTHKEAFIKSLNVRLNREVGILNKKQEKEHDKKNLDRLRIVSKLKENFDVDELFYLSFIFSPLTGLSREFFNRARLVNNCMIADKEQMQESLRSGDLQSANVFSMSRKTKDTMLSIIMNGMYAETRYPQTVGILLERLHENNKSKLDKYKDVEFKKIFKITNSKIDGDIFSNVLNSDINEATVKYFQKVVDYAKTTVRGLIGLSNYLVNEKYKSIQSPIARNGFLSKYTNKKQSIAEGKNADEVMAQVLVDKAIFMKVDMDEHTAYSAIKRREIALNRAKEDKK